ncbi:MAG: right-handed parallel beta-helix repeat-containing protein [Saprospiraceae bacterium]|nr:right-handed parallel beta-helix repeat-containing protein [Saprospiraceae bacterium]
MQDVPTSGNVNFNREIILDWIQLKKGAGAINMVKVRPKNSGYIVDNAQLGYPNLASVSFTYMYNPPGPVIDIAQPINPAPVLSQSQVYYRFFYNHQIDKSNQSFTKVSELTNPNSVDINNFCLGTKFDIYLDGIFEVDIDKEFCNTNFYFTPDSRLIIRDGKRLTLTNSSLNSCDAKWDGVIIEGSGALSMNNSKIINAKTGVFSDSEKATVSVKDGCTFENNHTGMELRRSKLVSLTNSTFKDGHKGIVLESCPPVFALDCTFSQLTYGIESNHTSLWVSGGNFTGKSTANGSRAINQIGTGNYLSLKNKTFFTNWHLGVVTSRSSLDIDDCTFENNQIAAAIGLTGGLTHYIYKTTFKNGVRGVLSSLNSAFNDFSRIQKCTFDGFDFAVSIGNQTGNKGWLIYDNEITNVRQRGIRLTSSVFNRIEDNPIISADGRSNPKLITLEGSPTNIVSNNILDNLSSAPESNQITGIYVAESMGNLIQCNTVNGGSFGINVWGTSNGNYNRNTMSSSYTGLYCGLYPSNGLALMGQQMHRFNVWNNGSFNNAAKHLSADPYFVNLSEFSVDHLQDSRYRPNPISSVSSDWFKNETTGTTSTTCSGSTNVGGSYNMPGLMENDDNYDIGLIQEFVGGDFNFGAFNAALNFSADFRIYNAVKDSGQDSLFKNVPNIHSFMATHSAGNIGKLYEASSLIQSSRYADISLTDVIDTLKSLLTTYEIDQPHLTEQQQLLRMDDIYVADSTVKVIYANIRDQHLHNIDDVLIILNNIYDTLTPVLNQIAILRAVASLHKNDTLTTAEWLTLTDIAAQCPLSGGESVYAARGLLETKGDLMYYNDHDLCDTTEIRSSHTYNRVGIHPNPSSGFFTVYAPDTIHGISVYDMHGRRWIQQSGSFGNFYQLDGRALQPGLYIIKVECGDKEKIFSSKIIKID